MADLQLPSDDGRLTIVVGWNPIRQSFFGYVRDIDADNRDNDGVPRPLMTVGCETDTVPEPEALREPLAPFVTLDPTTIGRLHDFRAEQPDDPRTPDERGIESLIVASFSNVAAR